MDCMYYTNEIIENRETLTKLCIYFDTVNTAFLLSDTVEHLFHLEPQKLELYKQKAIEYSRQNKILYKENILKEKGYQFGTPETPVSDRRSIIRESKIELFKNKDQIHKLCKIGHWMGVLPNDNISEYAAIYTRYRLVYSAEVLGNSLLMGLIPVTDNSYLGILAPRILNKYALKHIPTQQYIEGQLASKTLSMLIPNFPALNSEEILEVRFNMKDELGYFRIEIGEVAKIINDESSIESIIKSRIQPRLDDIKLKIKSANGSLFRKIANNFMVGGGGTKLLSYFFDLPLSAQIAAGLTVAGKALIDIQEHQSKMEEIRKDSKNRGLVFLLDLEQKYARH